ncbi:MAG: M15 family peptidase, partial [Hyphomicrobiaceae bacterium]
MRDFVQGFETGQKFLSDAEERRYRATQRKKMEQEIEKGRLPTDKDLQTVESPFGPGGAIPEQEGGANAYRDAIASIESSGLKEPYKALGKIVNRQGDRALGRYQIMASNLPSWSQQVLGRELTVDEFLDSPDLQDQIFDGIFNGYVQKYGERGAASMWFTGSPDEPERSDIHGRLTGRTYADNFMKALGQASQTGGSQVAAAATKPAEGETAQPGGFISQADAAVMDPDIVRVANRAAAENPGLFALNPRTRAAGRRSEAEQREMVRKGWSKTMRSKHREGKAVDIVPINPETRQPDPDYQPGYNKIAEAMRRAAEKEGVKDLDWGGDWKSFQDKPHWQVSMLQPNAAPNADILDMGAIPDEEQLRRAQQLRGGPLSPPVDARAQPTMFAAKGGRIERYSRPAGIDTPGLPRVSPGRSEAGVHVPTDRELAAMLPDIEATQVPSGGRRLFGISEPRQIIPGVDGLDPEAFWAQRVQEAEQQREMLAAEQQRRRETAQPAVAAARGGRIPQPTHPVQRFQAGGQPANPAGMPDKYSRFRSYTQQIQPGPTSTPGFTPRRVGTMAPGAVKAQPLQRTDGLTPSQLAFKQAGDRLAAERAAAAAARAAQQPVAATPTYYKPTGAQFLGLSMGAKPQQLGITPEQWK